MLKDKLVYLPVGMLTSATMISGMVLSGTGVSAATIEGNCSTDSTTGQRTCTTKAVENVGAAKPVTASVNVSGACGFLAGSDYTKAFPVTSGGTMNTESDSEKPSMTITCNDNNGFALLAVGASTAVTVDGASYTNYMVGTSGQNIATGTSGTDSYWSMKISTISGTSAGSSATVQDNFNSYHAVPNTITPILRVTGATSGSATTTVRTDYQVYVSSSQAAGTYTGAVKYTVTHPSTANN